MSILEIISYVAMLIFILSVGFIFGELYGRNKGRKRKSIYKKPEAYELAESAAFAIGEIIMTMEKLQREIREEEKLYEFERISKEED